MYSKVYWVTCPAEQSSQLIEHYDSVVTPAIQSSEKHIGQQLIEISSGRWILISQYVSHDAVTVAEAMVNKLISRMVEKFDMQFEVIGEGNATRSI